MEGLGIDFSEIFFRKHGDKIFQDISNKIKEESKNNCEIQYIRVVFTIAFLTYISVDDINKIRLLGNIPKTIDIKDIQKIHKDSISQIQKYIKIANNENS